VNCAFASSQHMLLILNLA